MLFPKKKIINSTNIQHSDRLLSVKFYVISLSIKSNVIPRSLNFPLRKLGTSSLNYTISFSYLANLASKFVNDMASTSASSSSPFEVSSIISSADEISNFANILLISW